jgi:hypothetical protein
MRVVAADGRTMHADDTASTIMHAPRRQSIWYLRVCAQELTLSSSATKRKKNCMGRARENALNGVLIDAGTALRSRPSSHR